MEYNRKNNITPETIKKNISSIRESVYERDYFTVPVVSEVMEKYTSIEDIKKEINELKEKMKIASRQLEFEKAAE